MTIETRRQAFARAKVPTVFLMWHPANIADALSLKYEMDSTAESRHFR
jgi:hypothetical protein